MHKPTYPTFADLYYRFSTFPRSCAGIGVDLTLEALQRDIGVHITQFPSHDRAFDWTIPQAWHFNRASLTAPDGQILLDTSNCLLHALIHGEPLDRAMPLDELLANVHTRPDLPDATPYRTSYYARRWGLCMSHQLRQSLAPGQYRVHIDCQIRDGFMSIGQLLIPGKTDDEFVLSCHICHPWMANDNLSGLYLVTNLIDWLRTRDNRLSYRFILAPGTIGAIAWLHQNAQHARTHIKHGLIVTCVGDAGQIHYKLSRSGSAAIDQAVQAVLAEKHIPHVIMPWSPYGYDERQYNSPGFNLDFGVLSRSPNGAYPQYHTSLDNPSIINDQALVQSLAVYQAVIERIDANEFYPAPANTPSPRGRLYKSTNPNCEPMLGRRGLYKTTGGAVHSPDRELALLWVMNLADGFHGIDDIIQRSRLDRATIEEAAASLLAVNLIE